MRRSGLLHILAVSGENVVLLCAMGSFLLTLARVRRDVRSLVLIPFVIVYVVVTGATPSIVRAGVSGVVLLLANLSSRPTDGWFLWLVPGAFMLTINPNVVFDVSFQLSFAAVAGLLALGRPLTRLLRFLPSWLGESAAITAAASLSTAPVSMATFGQASLVAVPANVVGGFVLGPIMFLGMLSVFAGFVWEGLSVPLNVVAGLFTGFLLTVAAWFGGLSFAVYQWHGLTRGFLLVALLGAALVVVAVLAHRADLSLREFAAGSGRRADVRDRRRGAGRHRLRGGAGAAVGAAPADAHRAERGRRRRGTPPGTPRSDRADRRRPDAAGRLSAAPRRATHRPADPVARPLRPHRRPVRCAREHPHHAGPGAAAGGALAGPRARRGRAQGRRGAGARLHGPPDPRHRRRAASVVPTGMLGGTSNQDENDCALVVVVTLDGQSVMLPGDAEAEALEPLDLGHIAVVELPHHGSRDGLDDQLLNEMAPRLALVSVGPNKFGHPTPEMLALMASHHVPLLRTDRVGDITLTAAPNGLTVAEARPP